jgi:hypothetical protein
MTEAELQARIDADVQRVAAIARDSIGRWYRGTEQDDARRDLRFDTFMVLGIPVWDHYDEDGHERLGEREDVLLCCESRKHHVKRGILANASDRASIR